MEATIPSLSRTRSFVPAVGLAAVVAGSGHFEAVSGAQRPRRPAGRAVPVSITLVDSGQALGSGTSWNVSLADTDGDGDLDIFTANAGIGIFQPNLVRLNVASRRSETLRARSAEDGEPHPPVK